MQNAGLYLGGKCLPYKEKQFRHYKNAYELFKLKHNLYKK